MVLQGSLLLKSIKHETAMKLYISSIGQLHTDQMLQKWCSTASCETVNAALVTPQHNIWSPKTAMAIYQTIIYNKTSQIITPLLIITHLFPPSNWLTLKSPRKMKSLHSNWIQEKCEQQLPPNHQAFYSFTWHMVTAEVTSLFVSPQ